MLSTSRNVLWLMKNITVQIEIPYHMHASSGARLVPCALCLVQDMGSVAS
jgi:disulfide bond formation protein DsbB